MSHGIELSSDEVKSLSEGMERLTASLERFSATTFSGSSSIRIDAGGVGVWAATAACLCTLLVVFICAVWASYEFSRTGRELLDIRAKAQSQQDYLNAIYQSLPDLQKK